MKKPKPRIAKHDDETKFFDLSTFDGRERAVFRLKNGYLPDALRGELLALLIAGEFPKRSGRPPKPVHKRLQDEIRAMTLRTPGVSTADAGTRDRAYRPNRKRGKK